MLGRGSEDRKWDSENWIPTSLKGFNVEFHEVMNAWIMGEERGGRKNKETFNVEREMKN